MSRPMIRIHNAEIDEVIDREMTDAEYEVYLQDIEQLELKKKAQEKAQQQKQALLDKLGITEEEAKLLLSQKGMQ